MSWRNSRPNGGATAAKYRTPEHRATVKRLKAELARDGRAWCAQPRCLMPSRLILPGMRWCAGHDKTGTYYIGHVHERCNRSDGGVQARLRQTVHRIAW